MYELECTTVTDTCECRACERCDGEGVLIARAAPTAPWFRELEVESPCPRCDGSGRDTTDCNVHDDETAPALPARVALEVICPACEAGDHEHAAIMYAERGCECACHEVPAPRKPVTPDYRRLGIALITDAAAKIRRAA